MLRSFRILLLSSLVLLPTSLLPAAHAATAQTEADKAAVDAKVKKLAAAIATCDKGAAIPLDPTAKAPPVQYHELLPADFDMSKLRPLQTACQEAWAGAPGQKRLQLQWARVTVALNEPGVEWTIPQIKIFADAGSAEAQYLMFHLYYYRRAQEGQSIRVSREDAIMYLKAAAEQGHLLAMTELMWQYRSGPLLRRDPQMALRMARRIESAPPQGISETAFEKVTKARMSLSIASIVLDGNSFSQQEVRLAFRAVEDASRAGGDMTSSAFMPYVQALRAGKGTRPDRVRARQLLEQRASSDIHAVPPLADMLARGEGGPANVRKALDMLRDSKLKYFAGANTVLADLLLDGKAIAPQPQEAIQALHLSGDLDSYVKLAGLLMDYHPTLEYQDTLVNRLNDAVLAGEPGAAMALARLKLSGNSQFSDAEGGRALLKALADVGDRNALWMYAGTQYSNLDSASMKPFPAGGGMSDDELRRLLDEGVANKEPEAFLLRAKFQRKGVLYPQDDQAATLSLVDAANLGNVEALVLLGDAYDDGLGTQKNPRERLRAWRRAAAMGSLEAKKKIANAFTFDTFDKLITLREGITDRIALHNNGVDRRFDGMGIASDSMAEMEFMGMFTGRAAEGGNDALAEAVMNAFREAPAGLEEKNLVSIGKVLPDEVRVGMEQRLKRDGFFKGDPQGYWGPDARAALVEWVYAKGPLSNKPDVVPTKPSMQKAGQKDIVAPEIVTRVHDLAFKEATAAKTDKRRIAALKKLNALARYGDLDSRWGLLRNYHQARVVRKVVSPAEITRYGLDILVAKPEGMDKPEFEFIFDITQIAQDGKANAFGKAVLDAIRDDPRLQDPLTLGSIMHQFIFAPEACDSILRSAQKAGVTGLGSDGCDDQTMAAVIAFAKARGASGVDAKARAAAAVEVKALDVEAAK